jgi:ABC-type nickel/cobalt efflux system permease component RcnA
MRGFGAASLVWVLVAIKAAAHPVPDESYYRTVRVRLTPRGVEVAYRLDVPELTVNATVREWLTPDRLAKIRSVRDVHEAYTDAIAPLLADGLDAKLGERPLTFRCATRKWHVEEHLQIDFVFVAEWPAPVAAPATFWFEDNTFRDKKGQVDLDFGDNQGFLLRSIVAPSAALKARAPADRDPGDDQKLRTLSATLERSDEGPTTPSPGPALESASESSVIDQLRHRGLVALLDTPMGMGMLLLLAGLFGAAHALTPGHGKTLVAAYLVGERGTVAHALLLGMVTTVTHTGGVIAVAALLAILGDRITPAQVHTALAFFGGLLIASIGVWLLLARLAGKADHVHIGGGHSHSHSHAHSHDHHHHHAPVAEGGVRIGSLIALGISGGIVPCWDAVVLLGFAITAQRLWLGVPLLLAFSAGLAFVLVAIGVLVVKLKGFGSSRWGKGRVVRALPIVSALAIIALGIWLCLDGLPK